ncbi:MAG: NADH:flavin oxidoreductase [Anaerolineae bacterium]|nr:NADH:flavin oxidoreductase [Anaerolineae bacterium]
MPTERESAHHLGKLFEPGAIGALPLTNRFVRSATAESLADDEGYPLPQLGEMYRALAEGGVGLIITGHAFVDARGRCHQRMAGLHKDELIPHWQSITRIVHDAGGKIAVQINHGGRQCAEDAVIGPLLAPSPIAVNADRPRPKEMSEAEIRGAIRAYALAAGRAKAAGFDAVQLHGAHGYLIHSFNSPASNWRRDSWGGSAAKRLRFLEAVASAVRGEVGGSYPLFIKLGTVDWVRDGLSEDDGIEIVRHLRDMGFDGVEISGGIGEGNSRKGVLHEADEAYFLPVARKARTVTDLPIILVGGMRSLAVMARILDEGAADFISLCRPLIREPDLPNRLKAGQDKATCVSCGQCWPRVRGQSASCRYVTAQA